MEWIPISEDEILELIHSACDRMTVNQMRLWELIQIKPEKWQQIPWGDAGNGFWAVALVGRTVVWYNDIEDGFNRSNYKSYRVIDEYLCDQDRL